MIISKLTSIAKNLCKGDQIYSQTINELFSSGNLEKLVKMIATKCSPVNEIWRDP